MKTINETFEDSEIILLEKAKGDMTWRKFILQLIEKEDDTNENNKTNESILP